MAVATATVASDARSALLADLLGQVAVAAAVPISGLTAWQALFDHAGLMTGQTVLIHGAAGREATLRLGATCS